MGSHRESVRWAFRFGAWSPSRSEWLHATRCVQLEEKERIRHFVFKKDCKAALAGRLLLRRLICDQMKVPWSEIRLERTPRGKPFLASPLQEEGGWSFNVSHQGEFAVLAADRGRQVGVDVMKIDRPGTDSLSRFFKLMSRQLTDKELSHVLKEQGDRQQLSVFYRYWTLKESFLKAIGCGLNFNLQRVEFVLSPQPITTGHVINQTKMHLDQEEEEDWVFEETLLDEDHVVSVAMGPLDSPSSAQALSPTPPPTFTLLTLGDLIASATPLTEEDPALWDEFQAKEDTPTRQSQQRI